MPAAMFEACCGQDCPRSAPRFRAPAGKRLLCVASALFAPLRSVPVFPLRLNTQTGSFRRAAGSFNEKLKMLNPQYSMSDYSRPLRAVSLRLRVFACARSSVRCLLRTELSALRTTFSCSRWQKSSLRCLRALRASAVNSCLCVFAFESPRQVVSQAAHTTQSK